MTSLLSIFVLLAVGTVAANEAKTGFSFYEYLHGEWVITRSTYAPHSSQLTTTEWSTHYHISKENDTQHLIGTSYDNDTTTGEIMNQNVVHIEFTSSISGIWRSGLDEDSLNPQFKFEFLPQTHDLQISAGEWNMNQENHNRFDEDEEPQKVQTQPSKKLFYLFQIATWDKFVITVFQVDEITQEKQIFTLYQGKKIPKPVEQTWFETHKTTLMLVGFFIIQMIIKARAAQREAANVNAAAPATPAVADKKNK